MQSAPLAAGEGRNQNGNEGEGRGGLGLSRAAEPSTGVRGQAGKGGETPGGPDQGTAGG